MLTAIDRYASHIKPQDIVYIGEFGCNNGSQTIELKNHFINSTILCAEPDPKLAAHCHALFNNNKHILFNECAIGLATPDKQTITFNQSNSNNNGIGSLFKPNGQFPLESMPTSEINVPYRRLDTVMEANKVPHLDLMWLDCQGGELELLKSMGDKLNDTKVIWTEFFIKPIYEGAPVLSDLDYYLINYNFNRVFTDEWCSGWFGDALYIKQQKPLQ